MENAFHVRLNRTDSDTDEAAANIQTVSQQAETTQWRMDCLAPE